MSLRKNPKYFILDFFQYQFPLPRNLDRGVLWSVKRISSIRVDFKFQQRTGDLEAEERGVGGGLRGIRHSAMFIVIRSFAVANSIADRSAGSVGNRGQSCLRSYNRRKSLQRIRILRRYLFRGENLDYGNILIVLLKRRMSLTWS